MMYLKLVVGFLGLAYGADLLVKGSSRVATSLGVSSLVIGLTVVALGTSAPEMAVSVMSALKGTPEIAIGNVIGSNIFNVLFILGISSLILPLIVDQQLIRLDVPVLIAASAAIFLFAGSGTISAWEAGILLIAGIVYTLYIIRMSRKETSQEVLQEYQAQFGTSQTLRKVRLGYNILLILIGLALLVFGSRFLVDGAVGIASSLGVSKRVIGLTIVAVGTSLPEVATSITAGIRGERDIAIGNVVGSNIFNILYIVGVTGLVSKGGIQISNGAMFFDLPFMFLVAVACLPLFFTGHKLDRWEGAVFLVFYFMYIGYLIYSQLHLVTVAQAVKVLYWFGTPLLLVTALGIIIHRPRKQQE